MDISLLVIPIFFLHPIKNIIISNSKFYINSVNIFYIKGKIMDPNFNLNLFVGTVEEPEEFDIMFWDDNPPPSESIGDSRVLCLDAFRGTQTPSYITKRRESHNRNQTNYRKRKRLLRNAEERDQAGDDVFVLLRPQKCRYFKMFASESFGGVVTRAIFDTTTKRARKIIQNVDTKSVKRKRKKGARKIGQQCTVHYDPNNRYTSNENQNSPSSFFVSPPVNKSTNNIIPKPPNIHVIQQNVYHPLPVSKNPTLGDDVEIIM